MYIVIIGDGKVGKTLTEHLSKENHDIVVIDTNPEIIEEIVDEYDVKGIYGNGASYDVQKEAGVDKADLVIAVTSSDEINILCCLVAKKLGASQTIARVRKPEYEHQVYTMRNELGISMAINPELEAAKEISRILRFPSAIKMDTFANGKVDLVEFRILEDSPLVNTNLLEIHNKFQIRVLVCAVQRNDEVFIPKGDFILKAKDYVYITAAQNEISKFFKILSILKEKSKTAMVIGGGKITYYLASKLLESGISVKIIESDEKRCRELSEAYPGVIVINGDGSNQKLLLQEGITSTDSLVALTGFDETNIVVSTFGREHKVDKVIAKIDRFNYGPILEMVGLDSVISPKDITANIIIRYVRAMKSSIGSEFKTLYRLVGNKVEALEFYISKASSYTSIPLKDLSLKDNVLIASIIRDEKVIIPNGFDTIEENDTVIIFTTNQQIRDLKDILK